MVYVEAVCALASIANVLAALYFAMTGSAWSLLGTVNFFILGGLVVTGFFG